MENTVFAYSEKENSPTDKRLKAIVIWPEDDLGALPSILPLGGSFEKDKEIRNRLEKALG